MDNMCLNMDHYMVVNVYYCRLSTLCSCIAAYTKYMPSHNDTNIPSILSLQLTINTYCVTFC